MPMLFESIILVSDGEVSEWFKVPLSKSGVLHGTGSSNLPLSAKIKTDHLVGFYLVEACDVNSRILLIAKWTGSSA